MKKILVVLFFSFIVVGCGGGGQSVQIFESPATVLDYKITGIDISEEEKSQLQIEGISEDENGNNITTGAMSDVIATKSVQYVDFDGNLKTEKNLVLRSFNVGRWKGQLNQETTLLARVFMDFDLMALSENERSSLSEKLMQEKIDFEYIYDIQQLFAKNQTLFETMYFDKIKYLQNIVKSFLSSKQKRANIKKRDEILSNFKDMNTSKQNRSKSDSIFTLSNGIDIRSDDKVQTFYFANYFNMYYGLRLSKIENKNQDYDYPLFDPNVNIVKPVEGGVVGGLFDWVVHRTWPTILQSNSMSYEAFDGDLFIDKVAQANQKRTYEVFKNQWGYPSMLNAGKGLELVVSTGSTISSNYMKKIENKLKSFNDGVKFGEEIVDSALTMSDMLLTFSTYYYEITQCTDTLDSKCKDDEVVNLRKIFLNTTDNIRESASQITKLLTSINYTPSQSKQSYREKNLLKLAIFRYPSNGKIDKFGSKFEKLLSSPKVKDSASSIRIQSQLTYHVLSDFYHSKFKDEIDEFNKKHDYSFDEMIFISSFWYLKSGNKGFREKLLKEFGLKGISISNTVDDFKKIVFNTKSFPFIKDYILASVKDLRGKIDAAQAVLAFTHKIENFKSKDLKSMTLGSISIVYNLLGKEFFKNVAAGAIKNAILNLFGGGTLKVASLVNYGASYGAGMWATPGKSYFMVETDSNGKIQIKAPPYRVIGVEDNGIYKLKDGKSKIYRGNHNRYLVVTGDKTYYKPYYKVYIDGYNFINTAKDMGSQAFLSFKLNVKKSSDDTMNNFQLFGGDNNNFRKSISGNSVYETKGLFNGFLDSFENIKDDTYAFDIYDALRIEQGGSEDSVIFVNKTRGIFEDFMEYEFYQPQNSEFDDPIEVQGIIHTLFKVADKETIRQNLRTERVGNSFNIQNNGDFDICFTIYYEKSKAIIDDKFYYGDICIPKYKSINLSEAYMKFAQDGTSGQYNDAKFIFFDGIAERFFEEEGYWNTKYYQWLKDSSGLEDMTYELKIDNLQIRTDSDGDGLSDVWENQIDSNPYLKDSDGDKIDDGWEVKHGLDPTFDYDAAGLVPNRDGITYYDLYRIEQGIDIYDLQNTISGKVATSDGTPLPNITVKFEYITGDKNTFETDTTAIDGTYKIELSKEDFDNFKDNSKLVISAYADGYNPKIKELVKSNQDNFYIDFTLEPLKENEIIVEIEPKLHHLGDGNYGGSANSDFQRAGAEGVEFVKAFYIDLDKYNNYQRAEITFEAKGAQRYSNKLFINNSSLDLQISPSDGSYETQKFSIDKSVYIDGYNEIKITSGQNYSGDYDDFEFINIKITFVDPVNQYDFTKSAEEIIREQLGESFISFVYSKDLKNAFVVRSKPHFVKEVELYDLRNGVEYVNTIATYSEENVQIYKILPLSNSKLVYLKNTQVASDLIVTYDYANGVQLGSTYLDRLIEPDKAYITPDENYVKVGDYIFYYINISNLYNPVESLEHNKY